MQERIKSSEATENFVEHNDVPQWILNTHSLHNGHLLRRCLPRDLIVPIHIIEPVKREGVHHETASVHRPKQAAKRAEAAGKRAAKRLKVEPVSGSKVLGKRKADSDEETKTYSMLKTVQSAPRTSAARGVHR